MATNRPIKKRTRNTQKADDFIAAGGTLPDEDPAPTASASSRVRGGASSGRRDGGEVWRERAGTAKQTESQLLRYNVSQRALLERAKVVEGRPYSMILAELVWPVLEERYGGEVPLPGE